MKVSITTSAILHGLALTWALVSISAPASFEVQDVEALPVDIIPIESITQIQQGDKEAPKADKSATKPTENKEQVENAENAGNNKIDLKSPPTPAKRPSEAESAAAAKKVEKPLPETDPVPNEVKAVEKEETEVEQPTEVAALDPKPAETVPEVKPDPPQPAEKPEEQAKPEEQPLPENVPVPEMKPQVKPPEEKAAEKPPEKEAEPVKTAEKPTDKKKADKKKEMAKAASSMESDFNADEIAALLNKNDPSGGGAKRSTEKAALGGKKNTGGSTLSQTEMDALRGAIQKNWSVIPGMAGASEVRVTVSFELDESGNIIGEPEVEATGGPDGTRQALIGGARRAVMKSQPFKLPPEKYDVWRVVHIEFDPSSLAF